MPHREDLKRRGGIAFVVDDDPSLCEAVSSLLRAVGWRVQTFDTAAAFLAYPRPDVPACLVLDVRLPGMNGLELQRELIARGDPLPIIFMTSHGDIPMTVQAIKAGAIEFLPKPFQEEQLLAAVQTALEFDAATRRRQMNQSELRRRFDSLSAREREVMQLIVEGRLNKQAAAALGITEVTVKAHRRRVMEKMGARSLPELVRLVERVQR